MRFQKGAAVMTKHPLFSLGRFVPSIHFEHLHVLDALREGLGLGFARNPAGLVEGNIVSNTDVIIFTYDWNRR
jgi:hypothetical protein